MEQTFTQLKTRTKLQATVFAAVLAFLLPALGWAQGLTVSVAVQNIPCFGGQNGGLVATANGGASPYTYSWSTGATTAGISNLAPGLYFVTVTDNTGTTSVNQGLVSQPNPLGAVFATKDQICDIAPDGSSEVTAFGGVPPYSYLWSNGATTPKISNLTGGIYIVTVTDANGCQLIGRDTVPFFNEGLWLADSVKNACPGQNNGFAHISIMSGTAPYTILWSNGATTVDIFNLAPGSYSVTVTDANGCSAQWPVSVGVTNIGIAFEATTQICSIVPDGTLAAVPFGGNGPYTFLWSTGSTTNKITGLSTGTYSITVTDANGCTATGTESITTWNEGLWLMDSSVNVTCFGLSNGFAHISVMSGTPPYTYLWNTGATTADLAGLAPGSYNVTVTDANGCSAEWPVTITQPTAVTLQTATTPANCGLLGTATVTASGGTPPYQIQWANNLTGFTINVGIGIYNATVTDANGCSQAINSNVPGSPNTLVISGSVTSNAGCIVGGSAAVAASGGSGNYAYAWSNGSTTSTVSNLPAGNYTITVTDITSGCTGTTTINIPSNSPTLEVAINVTANATCLAGGSATVTVVGGALPLTYQWSTGATTSSVSNLVAGPIGITVTDATGCIGTDVDTVKQLSGPTVMAQVTANATCLTGGSATATATGGQAPYVFLWSNGQTTQTATNLAPGVRSVTVTDANGCPATAQVTITAPVPPMLVISATTNATCNQPGSATASAAGGVGPFIYTWSNGENTDKAVNLAPGTYTVTVTDANGCTATASVTISGVNNGVSIGDYVWFDNDQDGFQAPLETNGVPNVTVKLIKPGNDAVFNTPDDVTVDTKQTDSNGKYLFTCVTPGTYIITFSGIPSGYQWTGKNKVVNDCLDSDVNANGKTDPFVVTAGQADNLCYDAGIHTICINITYPGAICCAQTICEGETPNTLYESVPPAGGSGQIQYLWMQLVELGPGGPQWVGIPGATQSSYQPGPLYQTSYFMRCIRRNGCATFLESNIVKITVLPAGSSGCGPFMQSLKATPVNNVAVNVEWITEPETDNYLYDVEHSIDEITWNTLTTVKGIHNKKAPNYYSFKHLTPLKGENFYRIKRTSLLGGENVSDVRLATLVGQPFNVYPNPVTDKIAVQNMEQFNQDVTFEVLSNQGVVLLSSTLAAGSIEQQWLPLEYLSSGIYVLRIIFANGDTQTVKFAKQ